MKKNKSHERLQQAFAARLAGIIFFAVLFIPTASGQAPDGHVQSRPPAEPSITVSPDYFYPIEEILYIEGRAAPAGIVTVTLQKAGEKAVQFTVQADSTGEWAVAKKVFLKSGNWEVRARQQVGEATSGWSNPRIIQSAVTGVNFFGLSIRYVAIAMVTLVFLAVFAFLLFYAVRKIQGARERIFKRQIRSAEERFHRGITEIRKDLVEKEKPEHILDDLEKLEKEFDENIEDIDGQ